MMHILNEIKSIIETKSENAEVLYNKWKVNFRSEYFERLYWDCFPLMSKYYFEANPSYLYEYKDMQDLGRYPIVMLRDGLFGILDLFFLNPKPPKDFTSILLINKKFEKLIPKMWSDNVACYQVCERDDKVPSMGEAMDLLIYGDISSDTYWNKSLEKIFDDIEQKIERYKNLYFVIRPRNLETIKSGFSPQKYYVDFVRHISKKYPSKIHVFNNIKMFLEIYGNTKFDFFNFDQANIFNADSYLDHLFYSKNFRNIDGKESFRSSGDLEYNLSVGHKVIITDVDFKDNKFNENYLSYKMSGIKMESIYESSLITTIYDSYKKNLF